MIDQEKYIREIGSQLDGLKPMGDSKYLCRCPLCGDSQKSKFKMRGWFLPVADGSYIFHCFNCSVSVPFHRFLKDNFPAVYSRYIYELLASKGKLTDKHIEKRIYDDVTAIVLKNLRPLSDSNIVSKYIASRKIPRTDGIFIIKDLSQLCEIPKYRLAKLPREPRIALPVYNKEGRISMIITRAIVKNSTRYINLNFDDSMNLFGLYNSDGSYAIDLNRPIYVVEGAFDSLFLDNCIAANNADLLRVIKHFGIISKSLNFIFIPDADKRNPEVLTGYEKIIQSEHKIVILPTTLMGKDLNEIVLKNPSINIHELIESNIYQGLEAYLIFSRWKRS